MGGLACLKRCARRRVFSKRWASFLHDIECRQESEEYEPEELEEEEEEEPAVEASGSFYVQGFLRAQVDAKKTQAVFEKLRVTVHAQVQQKPAAKKMPVQPKSMLQTNTKVLCNCKRPYRAFCCQADLERYYAQKRVAWLREEPEPLVAKYFMAGVCQEAEDPCRGLRTFHSFHVLTLIGGSFVDGRRGRSFQALLQSRGKIMLVNQLFHVAQDDGGYFAAPWAYSEKAMKLLEMSLALQGWRQR